MINSYAICQYIRRKSSWQATQFHDADVKGKIIFADELERTFRKWDVGVWTGSSWLRIGTDGGHLLLL